MHHFELRATEPMLYEGNPPPGARFVTTYVLYAMITDLP